MDQHPFLVKLSEQRFVGVVKEESGKWIEKLALTCNVVLLIVRQLILSFT